jgi:hypothetical protein
MTHVTTTPHHPAKRAAELLGDGYTVRVLEPSPPANLDEPFLADDPAAAGEPDQPGDVIVTPTSAGDTTWDEIVASRPELADYVREHWLGNRRTLRRVPSGYGAARESHHRLAYAVVAEARRAANGKFGLRYTHGGYGTPFFGDDRQVRVEGSSIIVQQGDDVRRSPITTVGAAARFVGIEPGTAAAEHDSPELADLDALLPVTDEVGAFLGDWFGLAWALLEELRLTEGAVDAERTQLWPGHFDPAIAMGDAEAGQRATYGLSPGDQDHPEPYLYIGAWGEIDGDDPFWNAEGFSGASLPYAALLATDDPYSTALDFLRAGFTRLTR